ncbi:unnamed protein product [Agarophyton chilense]|eukprot:gb/GEZJ01003511.1/.p1 GENE.gb/GEZJ01003511.1/~~gb/GEZJ01003511.1/.p1  ORF type:complete len:261 (+),score=22.60 gb/GEZJ01003511.1/:974-1756(+)
MLFRKGLAPLTEGETMFFKNWKELPDNNVSELVLIPSEEVLFPLMPVPGSVDLEGLNLTKPYSCEASRPFGLVYRDPELSMIAKVGCTVTFMTSNVRKAPFPASQSLSTSLSFVGMCPVGKKRFKIIRILGADSDGRDRALVHEYEDKPPIEDLTLLVKNLCDTYLAVVKCREKLNAYLWHESVTMYELAPAGNVKKRDEQGWPSVSSMERLSFSFCYILFLGSKDMQALLHTDDIALRLEYMWEVLERDEVMLNRIIHA